MKDAKGTGQDAKAGAAWKGNLTTVREGCLREVAKYGFVALGYYLTLRFVLFVPPDFTLGSTLILSIFGFFLLNASISVFVPGPEVRALVRAEKGQRPQDGHIVAIQGPIVALAAPLCSPLQGTACCAYEYKIFRPTIDGEGNPTAYKDFRGFAYAPCAVRTPYGDITLMGLSFSALNDFEQASLPADQARERAACYIEKTTFSAEPLLNLKTTKEALQPLFEEPAREGRWDYCQADAHLTATHTYAESILMDGQQVTAIGLYSAEKQALMTRETAVLQLLAGDVAASRQRLLGQTRIALLFAVALVIVSHGMFLFLLLTGAFA